MKSQEFRGRKPLIESEIFGEEADFPANFDAPGGGAQNESFAAARFYEPKKHFDGRAFPGPVRTKKAENFPSAHRKRKVAYRDLVLEDFAQVGGLNR